MKYKQVTQYLIDNTIELMDYIKGLGVYVGTYTEKELKAGKDRNDLEIIMEETGLNYVNTKYVKKNGVIVGMKLYACTEEDLKI